MRLWLTLSRRLEKEYDYIIFDTPPVGIVIDAVPILKAADGVVIVARNNSTTYPELAKTVETVERTDAKIIGVILNRVKPQETRKGKGYYSRYGGYYSSSTKD